MPQALTKRDYASLCRYYDGRDDLVAYTLDTELTRLAYFVVTEDGRRLGGAAGAVAAAAGREEGRTEGVGQGGEGGGEEGGGSEGAVCNFLRGRRDGVMLRMANQSIFADMLEVGVRCAASRGRFDQLRCSVGSYFCAAWDCFS